MPDPTTKEGRAELRKLAEKAIRRGTYAQAELRGSPFAISAGEWCAKITPSTLLSLLAHIDKLEADAAQREGEVARLREVVGKLPKTRDGEIVANDSILYCPHGHRQSWHDGRQVYCCQESCWIDGCQGDSGGGTHYKFEQCFSTARAAASSQNMEAKEESKS